MARVKFTAGRVAGFKCGKGRAQSFLWCDTVPGLAVRVTPSSAGNTYIFQSKVSGKTMRVVIGKTSVWGIDGAQAEARRLQIVIDQGNDPRQVKADGIAAKVAALADAKRRDGQSLDVWLEYAELRRANWSKRHHAAHLLVAKEGGETRTRGRRTGESDITGPGILRPLLELPLQKIDGDKMRQWLKDESAKRPTYARLAFRLLRAFLNWCAGRPEYRAFVHTDACASRLARDELPKKA
jgi:Arm DNA-binding domain